MKLKKILALTLALVICVGCLAACGNKDDEKVGDPNISVTDPVESETPDVSEDAAVDLAEFYADIMDAAGTAPDMMEMNADMLDAMYPGLTDVETKQCLVYSPTIGAVAVEFAFIEVANEADVETVENILQARIDSQIESGAFYPSTVEAWQNDAEIVTDGNIVCLFVCAEKDGMIDALKNGTEVPAWAEAPEAETETEVPSDETDVTEPVEGEEIVSEAPVVEGEVAIDEAVESADVEASGFAGSAD